MEQFTRHACRYANLLKNDLPHGSIANGCRGTLPGRVEHSPNEHDDRDTFGSAIFRTLLEEWRKVDRKIKMILPYLAEHYFHKICVFLRYNIRYIRGFRCTGAAVYICGGLLTALVCTVGT